MHTIEITPEAIITGGKERTQGCGTTRKQWSACSSVTNTSHAARVTNVNQPLRQETRPRTLKAASIGAVMSTPTKITPEAIVTWRKERAQLDAGLKTIREPSSVTRINPACSFKPLAESSSVDLHVDDTCTKRLPCGASGRMHESDEGHPSDSSSSELTDKVRRIYEAAF